MADMDTRQKRESIVSLLVPSMIPGVVPTGTVTQAERQAFHWTYSGILAGSASPDPVLVLFTTEAFAIPAFATEAFNSGTVGYYAPGAIDFDGSTNALTRASDLTGNANSKEGLLSAWVRIDAANGVRMFLYSNAAGRFALQRGTNNILQFTGFDVSPATVFAMNSLSTWLASDGWFHVLASWNLATGVKQLYVTDADDDAGGGVATDAAINLTNGGWWIGESAAGTLPWDGALAEFYFANTYLDISVEANRRKFISASKAPVDLGTDGSTPTGTAPLIYLRAGYPTEGANAGTGGDFVKAGTFAEPTGQPRESLALFTTETFTNPTLDTETWNS